MRDWKQQLVEDLDLVCWWYCCPPTEKPQVIESIRADLKHGVPCFRAMADEVHRALIFCPSESNPCEPLP